MPNEDYALVLDYLPKGKSSSVKETPLAQIIGTEYFTLLEVIPKMELKALEKVYIGQKEREKVSFIKRRIGYNDLTSNSRAELENAVEKIVNENEKKFLDFYNNSTSITIRRHQLELLPGIGRKHVANILKEREEKPFESFADIEKRVPLIPNPKKTIIKRIISELMGEEDKYFLFTRKPIQAHKFRK